MHRAPGLHSAAPKELAGCAQGCMPLIQGLALQPPVVFLQCYEPTLAWKTPVMAWAEFLAPQIMLLSQEQENRMGGKKRQRSYGKKNLVLNTFVLPVFWGRKKAIRPLVRMFRHSPAALSIHASTTQAAQAPGTYLAQSLFQFSSIEDVSISAFLKSPFSSFLHIIDTSRIKIMLWCWALDFWSCFCHPSLIAHSHILHYNRGTGEGYMVAWKPVSSNNIFHCLKAAELWETLTSVNPLKIPKKIDDCSKHNLFLWMEKNRSKLKQREGEAACNFQHVTSATFEWLPRLKCKGNTPGLLTIRQTWQSSPLDQHSFLCLLSAVELSALHQ